MSSDELQGLEATSAKDTIYVSRTKLDPLCRRILLGHSSKRKILLSEEVAAAYGRSVGDKSRHPFTCR